MKDKDYAYNDAFKEDLIHQLYHLVEEVKKVSESLEGIEKELYLFRINDARE